MTYGNLAYKYDDVPKRTEKSQQNKRQTQKRQVHRDRQRIANRKRVLKTTGAILVMALSAGFMISQFVLVKETQQALLDTQKELNTVQAYISQKVFEMEQSVDLKKVEDEATTRLNMQRPEKYQTVYVDVKQDDKTEVTANSVEGFTKRLKSIAEKVGEAIVEKFSIK